MKQFRVEPDGGDSYIVVGSDGVANTVYRFNGVSHPLAALCECGGADDNRSATPPCAHIRAVEVLTFQYNAECLSAPHNREAAQIARELETLHGIRVNAPQPPKPAKVQCPHYKAIRRAFAIAKERGLDCSKAGKARARHAMEDVIGRCVESRSEFTGADWMRFGDAIKAGRAAW